MATVNVNYRDWKFEVDRELTRQTYGQVINSGADTCKCSNCKNYVAIRDKVFPDEVRKLFDELGIDYRKEVEVLHYTKRPDGLHYIGGWFHFKGKLLSGKDCSPTGGGSVDFTEINDNFSIGFTKGDALAYFIDKTGLIEISFATNVPWVIDKSLDDY